MSKKSVKTKKSSQPLRHGQTRRSTVPEVDGLSPTVASLDHNVQLAVSDGPSSVSLLELLNAIGRPVGSNFKPVRPWA